MQNITLNYKQSSQIDQNQLKNTAQSLDEYITLLNIVAQTKDYSFPESSINLPFDPKIHQEVKKISEQKNSSRLKYILVIGIGGSNLGTLALYDAIFGKLDSFLGKRLPKIIFTDTTSLKLLHQTEEILRSTVANSDEILINLISKSGSTTETIALFETIYPVLKNQLGEEIGKRIVVTTEHQSNLWKESQKQNFSLLEIPKNIVGRYSVLSAVGLFPLALTNLNIEKILEGARDIRSLCLTRDINENISLISASLIYLHYKNGKNINNNFFFNPELESVGKWYRQLMAESIGKEKDLNGANVHTGITPIVSIGSTDLHSMIQLYIGGPKDKFTTFIYSPSQNDNLKVAEKLTLPNLVEGIEGKTIGQIMEAIYQGVKTTYIHENLPFMEVMLPQVSEYYLGQYLQFKMIEMMFLAKLLNVNAFDEPDVEKYKTETGNIF